jgi:hypothetical protein
MVKGRGRGAVTPTHIPARKPVEEYPSCGAGSGIYSNRTGRTKPFDTFKSRSMRIGSRPTVNYRVWR